MALATGPAIAQVPQPTANPDRGKSIAIEVATPPPPSTAPSVASKSLSPRPRSGDPAEVAYRKALDEAIAPVARYAVSAEDIDRVKKAYAAVGAGKAAQADDIAQTISDPIARKFIHWYTLARGIGSVPQYRQFLDGNPAWPQRWLLQQRLEERLFTGGGSAAEIKAHFKAAAPETAVGQAALASAHLALGEREPARALAAKIWRDGDLPTTLETGFLERFKPLLSSADHRWRLDRLLMGDRRWAAGRRARAALIRRVIPLLPASERKAAEARLAVYLRSSSATKLMNAVAAKPSDDWGLAFQRIQLLRRADKASVSTKILLAAPKDRAVIVSPDDWWDERRAHAYEALERDDYKLAYELVRDAGDLSVNPLKEQRFMAGWIAQRYLNDWARAEKHFRDMRKAADGPLSRSRGDYWIGRALEKQGKTDEARTFYKRATVERDTFHALLAQQRLTPGKQALAIDMPARPTADEIAHFGKQDALIAAVIADKAGLGGNVVRPFLANGRTVRDSEAWSALVAHLADALGDTQMSLRIAKSAIAAGQNLLLYAYPLDAFPAYPPLRKPPEIAMLLAIARQETEFNTQIVSGAGARGLLQVMPITARHVCSDHAIKCDIPRLLSDAVYNTTIGSAYIGDRMAEFNGNYVLTLAGYNAGPGRARQWMRQFGDPRSAKVDAIDWIERIPFEETRNYVAKVLSNIQIYRARLGQQPALRLTDDLGLGG
ncbi:MAG: lytic transglycosylase domain-containing protein [Hyphomicrobiaceae bacterium]|nr:lytic transglycosylase domain-containing protein [Hyphomicrobiaceae bacterium]